MREELKELLDDYFEKSKNDDDKNEIIDFIENYADEINEIIIGSEEW